MNNSIVGITLFQRMKSLRGTSCIFWFKTQHKHNFTMIPYSLWKSDSQILIDGIIQTLQKAEKEGTKELNLILLNFVTITQWEIGSGEYIIMRYFTIIFKTLEEYFGSNDTGIRKIYIS